MKRILFVDDEDKVLRELHRALHPLEERWDLHFVTSASDALAAIQAQAFDIVATDVGMPEMDGVELLGIVRKSHPEIVRMMLVAEADRATATRASGEAHQLVPKPCSQNVLVAAVARACALHSLLTDPKLLRLVSKMETLPSVPSLYFDILEEMKRPGSTVESIGDIVSKDIGMTAKVLQMVNSAFFGLSQNISSPGQAATFLGLDTLKSLVLSLHTFSQFDGSQSKSCSITDIWEHSMKVATFTRAIMETEQAGKRAIEEGFLAGMMHDAGKLVLASNADVRYGAARELATRDHSDRTRLETRIFGSSHGAVGAYLLGLWGLPSTVVQAVAFHHHPSQWSDNGFSPLCAVHVGNCLAQVDLEDVGASSIPNLDMPYLVRLGLEGRLPTWIEACRRAQAEVAA